MGSEMCIRDRLGFVPATPEESAPVISIGNLAALHARLALGKKFFVKFILLMPYIPGWCPNSSAPTKNGDRNNGSDTVN